MPVFMIALISLAVFGAIGILLLAAVILEHKMKAKEHGVGKFHRAAMLGKH